MATGLHAQRDGVDRLVSPLRECFTNCPATTRGVARAMFIALSRKKRAQSTQQSGEHHAVVLGSDKSIQKKRHNPVLNSHPARKTQGETYRLKSSRLKKKGKKGKITTQKKDKTTSPTVCIQQSALWIRCFSSNLSYKNIKSTKLTARHVYEPATQLPLVLGEKTVLKHVFSTNKACLFQTKTICTQHRNIHLFLVDFFFLLPPLLPLRPACHFSCFVFAA